MSNSDLSAQQAAQRLGVSVSTLYAYVSRGMIRSEATPGPRRQRRYHRGDVEALLTRKTERGGAERALAGALNWGDPLCESSLTHISEGKLLYKGRDVTDLATSCSFEQVIELLWGDYAAETGALGEEFSAGLKGREPVDAFRLSLPWMADQDERRFDLRPQGVRSTGARILDGMFGLAGRASSGPQLAARLSEAWAPSQRRLLEPALILCADHELNVSAFTARCVASAGATPYDVVSAGLGALSGHRHGGHCAKVETLFREALQDSPKETLLRRMRQGADISGFGHDLYPDGDPRGSCLLSLLEPTDLVENIVGEAQALLGLRPNIDFALVALCHTLGLPEGSALTLFALGRTAGWIAHALEQYATGQLIRPRAKYVGA